MKHVKSCFLSTTILVFMLNCFLSIKIIENKRDNTMIHCKKDTSTNSKYDLSKDFINIKLKKDLSLSKNNKPQRKNRLLIRRVSRTIPIRRRVYRPGRVISIKKGIYA